MLEIVCRVLVEVMVSVKSDAAPHHDFSPSLATEVRVNSQKNRLLVVTTKNVNPIEVNTRHPLLPWVSGYYMDYRGWARATFVR